jgi:hypothetical protein
VTRAPAHSFIINNIKNTEASLRNNAELHSNLFINNDEDYIYLNELSVHVTNNDLNISSVVAEVNTVEQCQLTHTPVQASQVKQNANKFDAYISNLFYDHKRKSTTGGNNTCDSLTNEEVLYTSLSGKAVEPDTLLSCNSLPVVDQSTIRTICTNTPPTSNRRSMNAYMMNSSGMRSSLNVFSNDLANSVYDVVFISETWLQSQHLDSEIVPTGWSIFRKNRSMPEGASDCMGGGVFIAVKNNFEVSPVQIDHDDDSIFDVVACKIALPDRVLYLICFYIPPRSIELQYMNLAESMAYVVGLMKPEDEIMMYGDANLDGVIWLPSELCEAAFDAANLNNLQSEFLTAVFSLGVYQLSNFENSSGNVLDLVFTSLDSNCVVEEAVMTLTNKTSIHHRILTLEYFYDDESLHETLSNTKTVSFDFENADYVRIVNELESISLQSCEDDPDHMADAMFEALWSIVERHVPKKISINLTCPPHMDKSLRVFRNQRNKAWKLWKKNGTLENWVEFLFSKEQFDLSEIEALRLYESKVADAVAAEPKTFWQYIRGKRGGRDYPRVMRLGDSSASSPVLVANLFGSYFESKFTDPMVFDPNDFSHILRQENTLTDVCFSVEAVKMALLELDSSKGAGYDLIPPKFLKMTAGAVAKLLQPIFNASLSKGIFPRRLKMALVTPVFKSGDRANIENYRAISILPSIGKVFERLVVQVITDAVQPLISQNQHGFLGGKSVMTNLLEYTTVLRNALTNGEQVDVIYTDFSSAFDKVDHRLLIFKLERYGIRGPLLKWIESYLTDRKQKVKFLSCFSTEGMVRSGVPQGSILGPLLFIMFSNDLNFVLSNSRVSAYCDDTKIFKEIRGFLDCEMLQRDVDTFHSWAQSNGLELNIKKCSSMSFSRRRVAPVTYTYQIGGSILQKVSHIRDLGVILDTKLTFKDHVERTRGCGFAVLGFIKRRIKELRDPYVAKVLYCSLVLPILEFASAIWSPYRAVDSCRIESVQKQFLLFALKSLGFTGFHLPSYESRLLLIGMSSLEKRREAASACLIYDLIRENMDSPFLKSFIVFNENAFGLRRTKLLKEKICITDFEANSPLNRAIRTFNSFGDLYSPNVSKKTFKHKILHC